MSTTPATINLCDNNAVSIVLLNAIAEQVPADSPAFGVIGKDHGKVTIGLIVNGVAIPDPIRALTNVINRELKRVDEHASAKAREMVMEAGLDAVHETFEKMRHTMEQADSAVRDALRKVGAQFYDENNR